MVKSNTVYQSSGFFVLRTSLLPLDDWLNWSKHLESSKANRIETWDEALAADRHYVRKHLKSLIERAEVREALFVASPDFESKLDIWLDEPESERGQKVEVTLVRYLSRMACRSTPFGLFAGCTTGVIGDATHLELSDYKRYRRHTRLDMGYLSSLIEALERLPQLRTHLTYQPNTSLYSAVKRIRYIESVLDDERSRSYDLASVASTDYLNAVLERASMGNANLEDLAQVIVEMTSVSLAKAKAFVEQLVDNQILVSDLAPAVTGPEPTVGLLDRLAKLPEFAELHKHIEDTHTALAQLDAQGLGLKPQQYHRLAHRLEALPVDIHLPRLFQVDMVTDAAHAVLSEQLIDDLARGVTLLERMSLPRVDTALTHFREAFLSRYEGRSVPLVEVLDEECGIGFGASSDLGANLSPLLEDLDFDSDDLGLILTWDASRHALLLRLWERAVRDNAVEIRLTEDDLCILEQRDRPAPLDALCVMAKIIAASEQALSQGNFRLYIVSVLSESGAQLMGRMCHADPQLHQHVEAHLQAEEGHIPDAIFAEIVHLPEGRIGNILERPVLRGYEIPFLGRSGAPIERQIPIHDLTVSVVGKRIVLRSQRLGREVIPRLTSAHNYRNRSLGLYRFLCALQHQHRTSTLEWDWGPLEAAAFLPRISVDKFILSPARWTVQSNQLRTLEASTSDARFKALQKLRTDIQLPRFLELADNDKLLATDLDNVLCCEALIQLVKNRSQVHLVEMLPLPNESCTTGPAGRFAHEILVPFIRKNRTSHVLARPPLAFISSPYICRSFAPGSTWLYAKLYSGETVVDSILRDIVAPIVEQSLASTAVDRWFFMRYNDPHRHLRIRFHGPTERLYNDVLPTLEAAVAAGAGSEKVWRFQIDTYEREIERYGGPNGIELAEAIFCADSEAVISLINQLQMEQGLDVRWQLALYGADQFLNDFGLDLASKLRLVTQLKDAYSREFQVKAEFEHQLSTKYRSLRRSVEQFTASDHETEHVALPGLDVFRKRSEALVPYIIQLRNHEQAGRLSCSLVQLAASFIHMHANRLLQSAVRAQELVIYDFLRRCYTSRLARQGKMRPPPGAAT